MVAKSKKRKKGKPMKYKRIPDDGSEKSALMNTFTFPELIVWDLYARSNPGKRGSKALFEHPDQMIIAAVKYFEWCIKHPIGSSDIRSWKGKYKNVHRGFRRPYMITEFCHFCGVTYNWFQGWAAEMNRHPEFEVAVHFVRETCKTQNIQGAMVGQFNAQIVGQLHKLANLDPVEGDNAPIVIPPMNIYNIAPPFAESEDEVDVKRIDNGKKTDKRD